ncbi:MAG: ATP-binding cassette domain-containing protein, partial [Planctomycetota bacterium]
MFCECSHIRVRRGRAVVLDVDRLEIPDGRVTAVVGPNGSGKTTLLEVLALLRRHRGELRLWGQPARRGDRALQRRVVMVMHPGYLFRGSVWDNVLYGPRARGMDRRGASARADEALKMVGLPGFADRRARDLSAGERQRVNLARAIAVGADALLLDEPAANVDARSVQVIGDLLARLRHER